MANVYPHTYFDKELISTTAASVSVASSAVLYGLSVYTVFHVTVLDDDYYIFRLSDHFTRLMNSCKIIGIDTFSKDWSLEIFTDAVQKLLQTNKPSYNVFVRASFHITDILPGTRSRAMPAKLSAFVYDADPIVPLDGVRLKTSLWRRNPDFCIPSRAKVNGAYINSVLARQDAIDSGYDDCIFLDNQGHVAELSAANIFIIRGGTLITPGTDADILEGINRRTILELARELDIPAEERSIDLTELYIADEVFICGTSSFLTPVNLIDSRPIEHGPLTRRLKEAYDTALYSPTSQYVTHITAHKKEM